MNAFLGRKNSKILALNSKGQMAIEGVILLTVLISSFMFVTKYVREKKLISSLVKKPMESLSVMTAYGAWSSSNGNGCQSAYGGTLAFGKCHPNSISRSQSPDPSDAR